MSMQVKKVIQGVDPRNGRKTGPSLRQRIQVVDGHVLCLAAAGTLFPPDDDLAKAKAEFKAQQKADKVSKKHK